MPGYSLQNMIENVGSMNESVLCKMTIQILQCLQEYREKFLSKYAEFCPCDILFDRKGNLKVNFFLKKMMPYILNIEQQISAETKCKCFDFFHKKVLANKNQYFNLGYILLISAMGGINFEILSLFLEGEVMYTNSSSCCLLHFLIDLDKKSNHKLKLTNFINTKLFSDNFMSFLCLTLSFDPKSNQDSQVMNHQWIKISNYIYMNNNLNKVRVNMKELIKISRILKNDLNREAQDKKLNTFLNKFEIILQNNKSLKNLEMLRWLETKKEVVKDLSEEFGVESQVLMNLIQSKLTYVN
jgi:hypothetical protein